jgi:Peptidase C65 Otubain
MAEFSIPLISPDFRESSGENKREYTDLKGNLGNANKLYEIEEGYKIFKLRNTNEDEYPNTISTSWIPIIKMKNLFTFSRNFLNNLLNIKQNKQIIGWKKIRGDGNCYFRAVMVKYIENIHKTYAPISKLEEFLQILNESISSPKFMKNYLISMKFMIKFIKESIELKEKDKIEAFIRILNQFQNRVFDEHLIKVGRTITALNFMTKAMDSEFMNFIVEPHDKIISDMLTMGTEGGDYSLFLLPSALGYQVVQLNFFEKSISEQLFPDNETAEENKIYIIRRGGHFDLLYTLREQELDQYCFYSSSYYLQDIR